MRFGADWTFSGHSFWPAGSSVLEKCCFEVSCRIFGLDPLRLRNSRGKNILMESQMEVRNSSKQRISRVKREISHQVLSRARPCATQLNREIKKEDEDLWRGRRGLTLTSLVDALCRGIWVTFPWVRPRFMWAPLQMRKPQARINSGDISTEVVPERSTTGDLRA
ncbi:hypothetical protein BJX65DRAFT_47984 [Aspergillus insuetus]